MSNRFMEWSSNLGRTPVVPLLGHPGAKLTNTTLKQNLTDALIQVESLKTLEKAVSPDALFTFMDLTVEAEALGAKIDFPECHPPAVSGFPVSDEDTMSQLLDPETNGRMNVFIDVVKIAKQQLDVPLGTYSIGPFTLASQLMGLEKICMECVLNPKFVISLVEKCTEIIIKYATSLVDAGADFYCILEPSAALISGRFFKKFSGPYCKEIFDITSKAAPILHICGKTDHLVKGMISTGAEALSLDSDVNFPELAKVCPEEMVLIGNVNPVLTVMEKDPAEIAQEVQDLRTGMKGVDNFILSTGCDLPIDTSLENIIAFVEAGKKTI